MRANGNEQRFRYPSYQQTTGAEAGSVVSCMKPTERILSKQEMNQTKRNEGCPHSSEIDRVGDNAGIPSGEGYASTLPGHLNLSGSRLVAPLVWPMAARISLTVLEDK